MKKRIISLLLVAVLTVSLLMIPASAQNQPADSEGAAIVKGGEYTTVFIHGFMGWSDTDLIGAIMPYWGLTNGDMMQYLRNKGYDVVESSIGPLSSCWDRSCELFAQLTGTKTDYGAAHSAKCVDSCKNLGDSFTHNRYGKDYTGEAIVDNWGPVYQDGKVVGWNDNKINLVGHSFGGPNTLVFLDLLAEGDQDEINWGKEQAKLYGGDWHDYVSPLFWGDYDGEYLVNSVTSLAGSLNGTSLMSLFDDVTGLIAKLVVDVTDLIGDTAFRSIYDFQLEQFGITLEPEDMEANKIMNALNRKGFFESHDNAFYELSVEGSNELKQGWKTYDNVYYFSYAGDKTVVDCNGVREPASDMTSVLNIWSYPISSNTCDQTVMDINGNVVGTIDSNWFANDGMVNTISARYPIGAANKPYDANNIEAGIWQWKEVPFDHFQFNGSVFNSMPSQTRAFYLELMNNIDASEGINPAVSEESEPTTPTTPKVAEPVQKNTGGNSLFHGIGHAIGSVANAAFNFLSRSLNGFISLFI